MQLDLDLLEAEQLVGRLKLLELLERQSHYQDLPDRAERRLSQALSTLPVEWRQTALALFGTIQYVPKQLLDDAWRFLWWRVCHRLGSIPRSNETLVLELDRDALRDDFYRANSLVGRLQDNLPFRSPYDLVDHLRALEAGKIAPELESLLAVVLRRPLWLLLVDMSISGGSVVAEIDRLRMVRALCSHPEAITIIALIQVCTEEARQALAESACDCETAVTVPLHCALNGGCYSLLSTPQLIQDVHELCRWFGKTHVIPSDYRLSHMSVERDDPDLATYGFGKRGWAIVTHKNTPNNSLPIFWFRPRSNDYLAPFERIDSRIGPSWSGRREWLDRIARDRRAQLALSHKLAVT